MRDVIFRQYDKRWGSLPYPTKSYSFEKNGCGCCAVTHLLIEFAKYKDYTPKNFRMYMVKQGFATEGHGTTHQGIKKTLERFGRTVEWPATMPEAFDILDKGNRTGILLMKKGTKGGVTWTTSGHYIAFLKYKKENGKHWFYIKDSGARKNDGWYCYEDHMKGLIKQIWIIKLPTKKVYYEVGKTYTVVAGVNVRAGVGVGKKKVGYLKKGTKVKCLGVSKNGKWIRHGKGKYSCGRGTKKVYIK